MRVRVVESSRLFRQFERHKDLVYSAMVFSRDGRMLLSGSLDMSRKMLDLAASQPSNECRLIFTAHADFVPSVAYRANGLPSDMATWLTLALLTIGTTALDATAEVH